MKIGKRNKFPKMNNGGYSLVELLVVIGIMAALLGAVTLSLMLVKNARDKKVISSIKTGVGNTRIETLAKEGALIEIYTDGDSYYIKQTIIDNLADPGTPSGHKETVTIKNIGPSRNDVLVDGTSKLSDYGPGDPIKIAFSRTTGAVDMAKSNHVFTRLDAGKHNMILQPKTGKCLMDQSVGAVPTP